MGVYENITALPGLLIALGLGPVIAFGVLRVMKFMFDGELDLGPGIVAIFVLITILVLTIMSKSHVVAGVVMVSLLSLIVFFPYALDQLAQSEVRGMDIDKLDKVHQEIISRPGNVASYFALADLVYALGLKGHAIVITEQTLERLSTQVDPTSNQSLRDVFKAEESRAKEWRRRTTDPAEFKPAVCPRCKARNEPGTIACRQCQGPFLLDLARKVDTRPKIRSKLVFGWTMVAGLITGTVYIWTVLDGDARWFVFGCGLAVIAGVFTWLFGPRKMGRR